ncbi:malate synthase G [Candidatus Poribacteria bacterium]|nr:malate synthase G [Candidatus Poribacteria bacterium]
MAEYIQIGSIKIDKDLFALVSNEIAPDTEINAIQFWNSFDEIVHEFADENKALLKKRDTLQEQIDAWYLDRKDEPIDHIEYKEFLTDIGYLVPEGSNFIVSTENVDLEIAIIAGPQLVVPVDNARYALNATNARWGSLYDALYGTDVIDESDGATKGTEYNPVRGKKVIEYTENLLDEIIPIENGSYTDVYRFYLKTIGGSLSLRMKLHDGDEVGLEDPKKFVGFNLNSDDLSSILFQNNGLHIEILIDREHPIGKEHPAGISDVILESAITTIQDCEDSVAAVDAEDKVRVYRNWNGIMKGTLETTFAKNGETINRKLVADKSYTAPDGSTFSLSGRSLLLIRNVGIHMYTDAVLTSDDQEIPEGILDAMITSFAALHDLQGNNKFSNSKTGSVYIVKPKFHGPDEVEMTMRLFSKIEKALGIQHNTLKIGIMDEERRTTVNLKEVLRIASERLVFINTGFLDRTGDEIHTSMVAGPMIPKMDIRNEPWMRAYENWNVDIGIETGLPGITQIGKGMWTKPDEMAEMLETKVNHPLAGATTAWVPSPTAATLHAIHYHKVDVSGWLQELALRERASLTDLLTPPLLVDRKLNSDEIQRELDNNVQGIIGYVVRWVDQGIGCSKIPDINNVGLMEDRATLRISSQHIANWLHHDIISKEQIIETFKRMAKIVDQQNEGDPNYRSMSSNFDGSIAFQAALDLVFKGTELPNGYTEFILHPKRREVKAKRKNMTDGSNSN